MSGELGEDPGRRNVKGVVLRMAHSILKKILTLPPSPVVEGPPGGEPSIGSVVGRS